MLARFLTKKGFTFLSAGTLQEGITIFREKSPRIVFLDVYLPDANSLKELQSFINVAGKKIIIMSALDNM